MATSTHKVRRRVGGPIAVFSFVAAVAAAAALAFVFITQSTGSPNIGHDAIGHTLLPEFTTTPTGVPTTAGASCPDELDAAAAVITASESGAENWAAHIQARTDGLSGEITNEQMREIWRVTREAGPDDLDKFTEANEAYAAVQGTCDHAADVLDEFTDACATRVELATEAVDAARTVIGEWHGHQENMAAFADGGMTADEAQSEWEEAWARAPDDFEAYEAATGALDEAPGCAL